MFDTRHWTPDEDLAVDMIGAKKCVWERTHQALHPPYTMVPFLCLESVRVQKALTLGWQTSRSWTQIQGYLYIQSNDPEMYRSHPYLLSDN